MAAFSFSFDVIERKISITSFALYQANHDLNIFDRIFDFIDLALNVFINFFSMC